MLFSHIIPLPGIRLPSRILLAKACMSFKTHFLSLAFPDSASLPLLLEDSAPHSLLRCVMVTKTVVMAVMKMAVAYRYHPLLMDEALCEVLSKHYFNLIFTTL